jgi:hypothetical protein
MSSAARKEEIRLLRERGEQDFRDGRNRQYGDRLPFHDRMQWRQGWDTSAHVQASRAEAYDEQAVPQSEPEPVSLHEVTRLARYIEPGDSFGERVSNSDGKLCAGVVVSVDRENGLVRVRYTSGVRSGTEGPEKPDSESFSEIIAGRQRREKQELPSEPLLFAMGSELCSAQQVPLYEPVRFGTEAEMASAVLRRDGIGDFRGTLSKAVRTETGLSFFEATSAPGNQTTYTYLLMREVAVLDRASGKLLPSEDKPRVGMTKWDRVEVDQRPGFYYVNAHQNGNPPKDALLLGPFGKHLDALLCTEKASNYVVKNFHGGIWFSFGTARLDTTVDEAPRGRFNAELLTPEEQALLLVAAPKVSPESVVFDETTGGTCAFFDWDAYAVYGLDGEGQLRIQSIAASEAIRGRSIVEWVKQTYGLPIVADEVAVGAEGFWDRMVSEGLVGSWSDQRFPGHLRPAPQTEQTVSLNREPLPGESSEELTHETIGEAPGLG